MSHANPLKDSPEFETILRERWSTLDEEMVQKLVRYREEVIKENSRSNITRLVSPEEFFEGHLRDIQELNDTGFVEFPAMDLGSGLGVPGIPASITGGGQWLLTESESRKALFLERMIPTLGLKNLGVFKGRGEDYLDQGGMINSVVIRAVGPIDRIYKWFRRCSTWNNLILLKGPKWEEEWKKFEKTEKGKELEVELEHEYSVKLAEEGDDKNRRIIRISRKPSA